MKSLNPNHSVTQVITEDFMFKMVAVLVMKAGGNVEVTLQDLEDLNGLFDGEMPILITHAHDRSIELKLVSEIDGNRIAREHGGLPQ